MPINQRTSALALPFMAFVTVATVGCMSIYVFTSDKGLSTSQLTTWLEDMKRTNWAVSEEPFTQTDSRKLLLNRINENKMR